MWFIRHCDKAEGMLTDDGSDQDPCCSEPGYVRSAHWSTYFLKYMTPYSNVGFYASNYKMKATSEICVVPEAYRRYPRPYEGVGLGLGLVDEDEDVVVSEHQKKDKVCHRSQRMYLTANIIRHHMADAVDSTTMNAEFCSGEYNDMMKAMRASRRYVTDTITVWEHDKLVDMLQDQGWDVPGWPHDPTGSMFNLVFMVDVRTQKWYYDCYIYETDETMCPRFVTTYFSRAQTISEYFNSTFLRLGTSTDDEVMATVSVIHTLTAIVLVSLILCACCIVLLRGRRRRRTDGTYRPVTETTPMVTPGTEMTKLHKTSLPKMAYVTPYQTDI
jgi:hypothetical protein